MKVELDRDRVLYDVAEVEEIIAALARELERVIDEREAAIVRAETAEAKIVDRDSWKKRAQQLEHPVIGHVAVALQKAGCDWDDPTTWHTTIATLASERAAALERVDELVSELTACQVGDSDRSLAGEAEWAEVVALRRIEAEDLTMQRVASHERLGDVYGHSRICVPAQWIVHSTPRATAATLAGALAARDAARVESERADAAQAAECAEQDAIRRADGGFEVERRASGLWYVRPPTTLCWYEGSTLAGALAAYDRAVKP